ncbi:response regulator [Pseudomonas sp. R5(2019)]|uniref:response regulator n=1 Tax=Pseudomonas sp. R5(2019) TaxID=2697566 RepID=UPI0014123C90|nr:response regulator [Pseudomonas sp. R5(2019)]NBA97430.1 response regulator [Pseudomonas sp. R5(2019)]
MTDLRGAPERAVILAPLGRDSQIAAMLLNEAGFAAVIASDFEDLCRAVQEGAGMALIANEALHGVDLKPLRIYLSQQPTWSDLPIVLMTQRDVGPSPGDGVSLQLGNVSFLERPFHPATLLSLVTTAIRSRRRQYEARDRLQDLSESEQRLQNALTAGRLGTWTLSREKRVLDCSTLSKSHFGRAEHETFNYSDWLNSVYPDDQSMMQESLRHSLDCGADYITQFRNVWPDGSLNWVDVRARAIRKTDGEVIALVGVSSDITERKQAEEQLRRLNENLEQQIEERTVQIRQNEEALRQAQKMEAVGQLTGGIAHDFNNMLTGIIGSLELIRRRLARGRLEDLAGLIEMGVTSANRAAALTHRLLAFSRRQSLDARPVEVNQLVNSMAELLQRSLNESVELRLSLNDNLWVAEADPNQLESALLNLVINARDAMPNGGHLTVRTENRHLDDNYSRTQANLRAGDYVMLSVSDDGCGMPQSIINRAFDPFFTTKPIGQGTGLGLSMIYGFTQQSRGHTAIQSQVGKGTTVSLFLPRLLGEQLPAQVKVKHTPTPALKGQTVLVVEDDSAVRLLVGEVLTEMGYAYLEAANADAAIPILNGEQRIDLMISDVGLPGMNGRQLAEIARQLRPGLRVLFITGYAEHAAVRAGFLDPGMQMISKPFAVELLAAKVAEMIGTLR